jgi:hypothetical protein
VNFIVGLKDKRKPVNIDIRILLLKIRRRKRSAVQLADLDLAQYLAFGALHATGIKLDDHPAVSAVLDFGRASPKVLHQLRVLGCERRNLQLRLRKRRIAVRQHQERSKCNQVSHLHSPFRHSRH